jgi:lipopolysaccharide transport system ATP-binding protein
MTTVLEIDNIWKEYRLGVIGHGSLRKDLASWWARIRGQEDPNLIVGLQASVAKPRGDRIWALRNICLEVQEGEVLGIIGRNGAGKSTLLKIISRVTAPTRGKVKIRGRVASLLEVGTGFHPELTGRENVFLNGAILGMTKGEIRQKFDEIVDFSGIETYIDTPVKRYSSGMYVRLAFAVAAHLEPEILAVDEVLAVGDFDFQKKCIGRMGDVARGGRTILFVSHNLSAVRNLCTRGIVLKDGKVEFSGPISEAVENYLVSEAPLRAGFVDFTNDMLGLPKTNIIRSIGLLANDGSKNYRSTVNTGEDIAFEIGYDCGGNVYDSALLSIYSVIGNRILSSGTYMVPGFNQVMKGKGLMTCRLPNVPLAEGEYTLMVAIGKSKPWEWAECLMEAFHFRVELNDYYGTGSPAYPGQGDVAQLGFWDVRPFHEGGSIND